MELVLEDLLRKVSDGGVKLTKSVVLALESACHAINERKPHEDGFDMAAIAQRAMPPGATEYERGLAVGIVFGLLAPES